MSITITATLAPLSAAVNIETDANILLTVSADTSANWNAAADTNQAISGDWAASAERRSDTGTRWGSGDDVAAQSGSAWAKVPTVEAEAGDNWQSSEEVTGAGRWGWRNLPQVRSQREFLFEEAIQQGGGSGDNFTYPERLDTAEREYWQPAKPLTGTWSYTYQRGDMTVLLIASDYEYAGQPAPGRSVPPVVPETQNPQVKPGNPDLGFDGPPERIDIRQVYIYMPSITLYRLSDGAELGAKNVSWSTDQDSWGWRFNAVLEDSADLTLIKPDSNGPQEIGCKINGHVFTAIVESYSVAREFGNKSYQIKGRSLSGWLSDPYAPKRSQVISTTHTAQQLAELELQNTGWTLNWQTADWLVPAGAFSYQEKDPIAVIKQIAESVGAVVQSHQSSKTIVVKPRYPTSPHLWSGAIPDAILPAALIKQTAGEYRSVPNYNRAITTGGDTGGVIVTLTRDGTAGDELAPVVTDPLITHVDAGYERGRNEIAVGGSWETMNITTLLTQNGVPGPGLMLPGFLVEIEDIDETYRTQIGSTSITAVRGDEALTVRQVLTAERAFQS